jgi:hypothetical protein
LKAVGCNTRASKAAVLAAKRFLDAELAKYKTWNHPGVIASVKNLFSSNSQFQQCKQDGVGRPVILKFLGPNWTDWAVRQASAKLELPH